MKKTRSRQLEQWLVQWQSLWGYAGEQECLNGEMSYMDQSLQNSETDRGPKNEKNKTVRKTVWF